MEFQHIVFSPIHYCNISPSIHYCNISPFYDFTTKNDAFLSSAAILSAGLSYPVVLLCLYGVVGILKVYLYIIMGGFTFGAKWCNGVIMKWRNSEILQRYNDDIA